MTKPRMSSVSSMRGFTLIELMIVVAIVAVLAAIAIPAYQDYNRRAKMSEVLAAFDAIATGATEYHAVLGFFPYESYGSNNLAYFSTLYADIVLNNEGNIKYNTAIVAQFKSTLNLESALGGDFGQLTMQVTYDEDRGYLKNWAFSNTSIDAVFYPKK